jgi:GH18 family chitinase
LYGFNGVDIDFEQGVCNISTSYCVDGTLVLDSTSVANYQALLSALSTYAKQVTTESSGSPLYGTKFNISAALPVGVNALQQYESLGGSYQTVLESVTYGNVMAYDYHGQFDAPSGVSDALAGLYRSGYNYGSSDYEQYYDINDTLTCGTTSNQCGGYQGYFALAPNMASKINLGIPTYTRVENLASAAVSNDAAIYQSLASTQTWAGQGGGVVSYRCLYNSNYCASAKGDDMPQALTSSDVVAWNYSTNAMTPWFYYVVSGTPYFGTFDNGQSAANKVSYANTQGLNGYFTWEIDEDVPMQDANYAQYGITNNICLASGSCAN